MDHHERLTVIFRCLPVQVNHQRVAVNGHICNQVVDIVVKVLVSNTAMSGGPEHPDGPHSVSQAICCVRWRRGS